MGMYNCSRCDRQYIDNDWHPCTEDPKEHLGLMCPICAQDAEGEAETPEVRQNGVFTQAQLDIIKKLEAESDPDGDDA